MKLKKYLSLFKFIGAGAVGFGVGSPVTLALNTIQIMKIKEETPTNYKYNISATIEPEKVKKPEVKIEKIQDK